MSAPETDSEIDFNHLNQYVGGDKTLTAEVFSLFKHQVEMWGRALNVDADDDVWESVTHTLKGTAKAVGATKLAEDCENAERLTGDSNRPGGRERALQNIEFRISRVLAEVQRWEYQETLRKLKS